MTPCDTLLPTKAQVYVAVLPGTKIVLAETPSICDLQGPEAKAACEQVGNHIRHGPA